jgi:biofilm PGA synthesis protein PgaA
MVLRQDNPDDLQLRIDTAVIAAWNGDDAMTLELLDAVPSEQLPDYGLNAVAKAARNIRQWDGALMRYDALISRHSSELDPRLGRILTLADAQRFDDARHALEAAAVQFSDQSAAAVQLAMSCGYIEEVARRFVQALSCYNRALSLAPDNREALRRRVMVASALGAADAALRHARATPGLLTADELQRLEIDAIAMQIRWSGLPDATDPTMRGTVDLNRLSQLATNNPELLTHLEHPNSRAYHFDRLAALVTNYQMREAITLFENLEKHPLVVERVPSYAYFAAGQAYLFEEQPGQAERCFQAALSLDPTLYESQLGLFYALSDQNRIRDAREVTQALLNTEPSWIHPSEGTWQENRRYAEVRQLAAMEQAYRDRYQTALLSLEQMLAVAPANVGARVARAQVLSWRGWYQHAYGELTLAELADPGSADAAVVGGNLGLDSHRFNDAEASLHTALAVAPKEKATQQLSERWRLHNTPEVVLQAQTEHSSGSAFANDGWQTEAYYLSKPIFYHYRAYLHSVVRRAKFEEGSGHDHRLGAGAEYRGHFFTVRGEVYQGLEQNQETGASASLDWHINDHMILATEIAANSVEIPLRAVRTGTSGNTFNIAATYRWHEAQALTAQTRFGRFDDGNHRQSYGADYRWRVLNAPRQKLLMDISGYASHNDQADRSYFNPRHDRALSVRLTHKWQVFRRYDHGLIQRFSIEAGDYWQRSFGNGAVWTLQLEHDWSLGPRWQLNYGINTGGRMYDGAREHANVVFLGLRGRL